MTLPKRNLALRVIYSLSMVAMFVFLGWQALAYDSILPTSSASPATTSAVLQPVEVTAFIGMK
ncbi:hypothetical protein [Marinobacterium jannaschii]|uniref:hypothetical protein n=1 Tax=Marinobacterium jannaschii TaxID=64970 RepID=UPI00048926DB|nr:hypothetical protein [Marinobacterium jannaschii]